MPITPWTSETARIAGLKGGKASAARRAALKLASSLASNPAPILTFEQAALLRQTLSQLKEIDRRLEEEGSKLSWKEIDFASKAKERLFKVYAHLSNIPAPGMRRPDLAPRLPSSAGYVLPLPDVSALPAPSNQGELDRPAGL